MLYCIEAPMPTSQLPGVGPCQVAKLQICCASTFAQQVKLRLPEVLLKSTNLGGPLIHWVGHMGKNGYNIYIYVFVCVYVM